MRRLRGQGKVSPVLLYLFGATFLLVAIFSAIRSASFAASAVHAEGELVHVRTISTGHGRNRAHTTYAELQFQDAEGGPHTVSTKLGGFGQWHEGEHVDVLYPRGQPGRAQVGGFQNQWMSPFAFAVGGLFALFLGWARSPVPQS